MTTISAVTARRLFTRSPTKRRSTYFGALTFCTVSTVFSQTSARAQLPDPPVSPAPVYKYEYDAEGHPTRTIQAPGVPGFEFSSQSKYDALGRPIQRTDAKAGLTQFGYDGLDRPVQVTDPRNLVTQMPRNGLGDVTAVVSPDTGTAKSTYDTEGNLKTRIDSRGVLATYSYDPMNRPASVVYSQAGSPSQTFAWLYSQKGPGFAYGGGHLTSTSHASGSAQFAYDPQGRVTNDIQRISAATGANAAEITTTVHYGRDAGGDLTNITYPSGRVVRITYKSGLPTAIGLAKDDASTATPLLTQIKFAPFAGPESWQWQLASGPQENRRVFDLSGRWVRYQLGGLVRDLTYDAAGRITNYTHYDAAAGAATSASSALDQSFDYDELSRIVGVRTATASWSIGYDANGNRTSVTLNGIPSSYATAPTSNRLEGTTNPERRFEYDNAGNTVRDSTGYTSTYDLAGRLATLTRDGATTSFTYDGSGKRLRKFVSAGPGAGPDSTVLYVYDQAGQLLGEYDHTGAALREYIWLGSTPVAMFTPDPADAANPPLAYFIHADHLDTPRVVVDLNNNIRWRWLAEPFGTTAPETDPQNLGPFTQNLRFPGQVYDQETGLAYNWNRYLDFGLGRYLQSDPIGLDGGINTYAYVGGNPLQYTDPNGLNPVGGAVLGAEIGTAIFPGVGTVVGAGVGLIGGYLIADRLSNLIFNRPKNPPDVGPPNGWIQGPRRGRQYGPDGAPQCDIDKPHQGNEVDHVHEWPGGVREEPGRPVSPWPRPGG